MSAIDESAWVPHYERVVLIDQKINAIDGTHARIVAENQANTWASRLSFLLDVGFYKTDGESVWVRTRREATEVKRLPRGRGVPGLTEMPSKGELIPLGSYKGKLDRPLFDGNPLSFPKETRPIARLFNSGGNLVDAFDACCRLYQTALVCGFRFPTVGLSYRVAAVEAICKKKKSCNIAFSEFMRNYTEDLPGLDEFLDFLYGSIRSAHIHTGSFPLGDFESRIQGIFSADSLMNMELRITGEKLIRKALLRWLKEQLVIMEGDALNL